MSKNGAPSASPEKLVQQLTRPRPGASIETAYESGFSGFVLHRFLEKAGIHNIVVNPGSIETQIKKIEQKLNEQAAIDPNETIYRSATGFGPLSARILSSELGDRASICELNDNYSATLDSPPLSFPVETLFVRDVLLAKGINESDTFSIRQLGEPLKKIEI